MILFERFPFLFT